MGTSPTSPGKLNYRGLDLFRKNLHSGRGRSFFLTSLFIELIEGLHQTARVLGRSPSRNSLIPKFVDLLEKDFMRRLVSGSGASPADGICPVSASR